MAEAKTQEKNRADELIAHYALEPHPEGGHFRRILVSNTKIPKTALSSQYHGDRPSATIIYFLLRRDEVSHLHKIVSEI